MILSTILELLEVVENRYLWAKIFKKKKKQKEVGMKRKDGNSREQDVRWPGGRQYTVGKGCFPDVSVQIASWEAEWLGYWQDPCAYPVIYKHTAHHPAGLK